jgi:hypothetical protein
LRKDIIASDDPTIRRDKLFTKDIVDLFIKPTVDCLLAPILTTGCHVFFLEIN